MTDAMRQLLIDLAAVVVVSILFGIILGVLRRR